MKIKQLNQKISSISISENNLSSDELNEKHVEEQKSIEEKEENDVIEENEENEALDENEEKVIEEKEENDVPEKNEENDVPEENQENEVPEEIIEGFPTNPEPAIRFIALYHVTNIRASSADEYAELKPTSNTDDFFDIGVLYLNCVCFTAFPDDPPKISVYPLGNEYHGDFKRVKIDCNIDEYIFFEAGRKPLGNNVQVHVVAIPINDFSENKLPENYNLIEDIINFVNNQAGNVYVNIHIPTPINLNGAVWDEVTKITTKNGEWRHSVSPP